MHRNPFRPAPLGLAAVAVLALAGCVGSIDTSGAERVDGQPTTINARELAATAEGIVAEQGFTVDIDCGTDDVPFEVGTSLECSGFDEASETSGTYTVTITSVEGDVYGLDVVGSEADPTPPVDSAFETAAAFADLTAQAISDALGETPLVDCGADDVEIFVGQEVRCAYESSAASGFVIATVTEFDGSTYAIEVVEE
jgi:hypothetical protein